MTDYKLRIPSAATRETIRQQIVESDDFHFEKAKLLPIAAGTTFQFPEPTEDDPEAVWRPKKWAGAVVEFKTCSFPSKNSDGTPVLNVDGTPKPPKEQRALHVVPAAIVKEDGTKLHGSVYPAFMYVNATSVNAWKDLCVACSKGVESKGIPAKTNVRNVLVEFTLKTVSSRDGKNKWNVWEFNLLRLLTEKELGWCQELLPMVQGRIRTFSSDAERDEAEASMYVGKPVETEPEPEPIPPTRQTPIVEEDEDEKPKAKPPVAPPPPAAAEEEQPKPKAASKAKAKPPVAPPPPAAAEEEDEPVAPKASKTVVLEDDEETVTAPPPAARRRSSPVPEEDED
jgi:hypothetical protein